MDQFDQSNRLFGGRALAADDDDGHQSRCVKISTTYSAKEETVSMRSTLRVARKRRRLGFNFVSKEK